MISHHDLLLLQNCMQTKNFTSITKKHRKFFNIMISSYIYAGLQTSPTNISQWLSNIDSLGKCEKILSIICEIMKIDKEYVKSKSRKREAVIVRGFYYKIARERLKIGFSTIGIVVGSRDHSTIIHQTVSINNDIGNDENIRGLFEEVERSLANSLREHSYTISSYKHNTIANFKK